MISSLLLNNFQFLSDITPTSSKGKESDELLHDGSVARYGPRTSCQRGGGVKLLLFAPFFYNFTHVTPFFFLRRFG